MDSIIWEKSGLRTGPPDQGHSIPALLQPKDSGVEQPCQLQSFGGQKSASICCFTNYCRLSSRLPRLLALDGDICSRYQVILHFPLLLLGVLSFPFRLLSQPVVSAKDIEQAQTLLGIWQQLIPELCHETSQNFNSHAAQHLPNQVEQFGPLWSINSFAFEGFNGHFARYVFLKK